MTLPNTLPHRHARRHRLARLAAQAAVLSAATLAAGAPSALADTTVRPAADTFVDASSPATGHAASSRLTVDGSPVRRALLRFTVPAGNTTPAAFRVWSDVPVASGMTVRTGSCDWRESATWSSRPPVGTAVATKPTTAAGWNTFTLPASVVPKAGGSVCVSITKSASTNTNIHAKGAAHPAELIIGQSANSGPSPAPAPQPAPAPAPQPAPSTDPSPAPAPAAKQPSGGALYGNPWAANGLANLEVGRNGRQVDYRFKADTTGTISSVRIYFIFGASGYHAGNGGDVRVTLEGDIAGSPSGTVLASGLVTDPLAQSFRTIPLSSTQVVAGQTYHLRFTNVDPNPTSNWVSVDDLGNSERTSPVQPWVSDADLAVLYRDGASGSWTHNTGHTPIFTLFHTDGSAHGPGAPYVNARSQSALRSIGGSNRVGELFTVSGAARTVRTAAFRLRKNGNPGALTMRLTTAAGTTIDSATVPASSIPSGNSWVKGTFSAARTLSPGQTYRLELSAPSGDAYQAWPLTEGSGFDSPTMFRDGAAQVSASGGASWSTPSGADDWQFYLKGDA